MPSRLAEPERSATILGTLMASAVEYAIAFAHHVWMNGRTLPGRVVNREPNVKDPHPSLR